MKMHDTTKKIFIVMFAIAFAALCIGLFFTGNQWAYAIGIILGTLFSAGRMLLLQRNISRSLDMEAAAAENYMRFNFVLRHFLNICVLILFAITPWVDLWGAVIGIFTLQAAVYIVNIGLKKEA